METDNSKIRQLSTVNKINADKIETFESEFEAEMEKNKKTLDKKHFASQSYLDKNQIRHPMHISENCKPVA